MSATLTTLIERLNNPALAQANVIPWGSPVPSFGDISHSSIATLGLNPSNREFVDVGGKELDGDSRRFHTLGSLGLRRWSDAKAEHLHLIMESCRAYFSRNPYDGWFKKLDYLLSGTAASYYAESTKACHLDLIPFATACKWTELTRCQRAVLLTVAGDTLSLLLRESPIRVLVLNGNSVVKQFEGLADIQLEKKEMREWSLPRGSNNEVMGYAYKGTIRRLSDIKLDREILVLGFNHNIQSSFGVTKLVTTAIRRWITQSAGEVIA